SDPGKDAVVLLAPGVRKRGKIRMQDGVEPGGSRALAGEAFQPDAVGHEDVVQCADQRAEEGSGGPVELLFVERGRRLVDDAVRPSIVGREHLEMLLHPASPVWTADSAATATPRRCRRLPSARGNGPSHRRGMTV